MKCPTHCKSRDEESAAQLILLCAPLKLPASLSYTISPPPTEGRQRKTEFRDISCFSRVCCQSLGSRERCGCATPALTNTDLKKRKEAPLSMKRLVQPRPKLALRVVLQPAAKTEKDGSDNLPAEYLASPLSKQPQEPQPKQVEIFTTHKNLQW